VLVRKRDTCAGRSFVQHSVFSTASLSYDVTIEIRLTYTYVLVSCNRWLYTAIKPHMSVVVWIFTTHMGIHQYGALYSVLKMILLVN